MSVENINPSEYTVLVVDDNLTNLDVAADYLEAYGFQVVVARDGLGGLDKVAYAPPNLILLDVLMPGMDGFEVCRRLKANEATREIPIIFMTALADTQHKVEGFSLGAVDYITKPVQQEEMVARVMTHLKIRALTQQLQQANELLNKINNDKDKFFSIVAHDLKGPFLPLLGNLELMGETAEKLTPHEVRDMSQASYRSARRVFELLETLLDWAGLQMGRMAYVPQRIDLSHLLQTNVALLAEVAAYKKLSFHYHIHEPLLVYADEHMINTVIRNLINNALKFSFPGGAVTVSARAVGATVVVSVTDEGMGIKPEDIARLFKIGTHHTTTGTANEKGTGLGLIMCQELLARHGGQIEMESQVGRGTTVTFTLPRVE